MHCSGLPLSPHTYHVYESSADQSDRQSLLLLPASKSAGSLTRSKVDVVWVLELCNQGIQNQQEICINPKSSAFVTSCNGFSVSVSFNYSLKYHNQCSFNSQIFLRARSQTTFTREGPKCSLFVNVHMVENVNRGGQVVKRSQNLVNIVWLLVNQNQTVFCTSWSHDIYTAHNCVHNFLKFSGTIGTILVQVTKNQVIPMK